MNKVRLDAEQIIKETIKENLPNEAVKKALEKHIFGKSVYMVAIGKAAWTMAKSAMNTLGNTIKSGIVITKYDHSQGDITGVEIIEAGHPISDENTILGTEKAISLAKSLTKADELLLLISGGGSSLFERPLEGITIGDIGDVNNKLLASGADIIEINMIRKRLSSVKAGRFAELCKPAKIFTVVLSDVMGDRLDSIASGPAAPDHSTSDDAKKVLEKYNIKLSDKLEKYINMETPKTTTNVETVVTGSVKTLCNSAANAAQALGYTPHVLSSTMDCLAREAGRLIASMAREVGKSPHAFKRPCAIILGGETVVKLTGSGKGGRNQELALAAAEGISGLKNTVIFSLGSDGTDGPTDAAGGIVDGDTLSLLNEHEINLNTVLENNDAYNALKAINSLILTGPTGTNVNDIAVILCK